MDTWDESEGGWSMGVVEYWKKAEFIPFSIRCVKSPLRPNILLPNTPLIQHSIQLFGARSLMTSRALMDREMSLYFCVKSIVACRSCSEIPFSKTGKPI